jgi:hypothetical protein
MVTKWLLDNAIEIRIERVLMMVYNTESLGF